MSEASTTAVIQRCLDALQGDMSAEPQIRALLEQSASRLRSLCAGLLIRKYPRLAQPPVNLETDELLAGVVANLLKALQKIRPQSVREFFAMANQHMRWQLNDLARLLDGRPRAAELLESGLLAPPASSESCLSPNARRILESIDSLPEGDREAFELIRIQGLTYPEAANVIGVSVKTVQRRLNRARLILAEQFADLRPDTPGDARGPRGETPPGETPSP
jgi:RNA polymerase sigma-70 factor (ECF subfamily)